MKSSRFHRVQDLYLRAIDLPPPTRTQFVLHDSGHDRAVAEEVLALLNLPREVDAFLEPACSPPMGTPALRAGSDTSALQTESPGPESQGTSSMVGRDIGGYRVTRVIAAGGMGVVYEAQQDNPPRTVALKVLRQAIASPEARRRFQAETRMLARLVHPGIATIYESGMHLADGVAVPFFAMALVEGARTITEFARERHLTLAQRIDLFTRVCRAVHHGHQRGVIHCDLKPGNILVSASGEPQVIDFGVARAIDADGCSFVITGGSSCAGTMAYMSPEQCAGEPEAIDTRSDVYALGVVLYELLAGRPPHDLHGMSLAEVAARLRSESPPRPSTFNRALRGDLDTIALKALAREPEARYQSAADLAEDLERWRRREPIRARPPRVMYLLTRYAQRNPLAFGSIALAATVLVIAAVLTSLFAFRAEREWRAAETARGEEARQRAVADRINTFLENMLSSVSSQDRPHYITVRDVLDEAARRADAELEGQPETEASIRHTLGKTYVKLALYDQAERHLRRAHALYASLRPEGDDDRLGTTFDLAYALGLHGSFAEAEAMMNGVLRYAREAQRPNIEICALENLAEIAFEKDDVRTCIARRQEALHALRNQAQSDPLALAHALQTLAEAYMGDCEMLDRLERAEECFAEVLRLRTVALGREHHSVAWTMCSIGHLHELKGDLDGAERLFHQALDIQSRTLPPNHMEKAIAMSMLASVVSDRGQFAEAEAMILASLEMKKRLVGSSHNHVAQTLESLGAFYLRTGRVEEGRLRFQECLDMRQRLRGQEHPLVAETLARFAHEMDAIGERAEARRLFERALVIRRRTLPADDPQLRDLQQRISLIDLGVELPK